MAWQLYLPKIWAEDDARRQNSGIPEAIGFATKLQIALQQLRALIAQGAPGHGVLADAGYGIDYALRQGLSDRGLPYLVGLTSAVVVWPPGVEPLAPKPYSGIGRPPARDAQAHCSTPAGQRQSLGTEFARQRMANPQLARRYQRAANGALCSSAGTLRRGQRGQGAPAAPAVAAHRVACRSG